jgi:hypothetical protein
LLKADVSQSGEGWSDSRIIEALETVNRLPNLTPDRRPILTLLSDGFGR